MLRTTCVALTLAVGLAGVAEAQEKIRLKLGHFLPTQSMTHNNLFVPMAERIKEETQGRVEVQIFPGGSLGRNPAQQLQLLMDGVTDISFIVQSYTPGEFPDNSLLELPLVLSTTREASVIHQRLYERGLLRGYDKVKVLGLATTSAYTTHINFPYRSLDDLKGRKIRVATSIQSEIVEALGATPVGGIAVTQAAESLSRGLIEGTLLGWESMNTFRVTPATSYHINVPQGFTPLMVGMNKQKYDSLPADIKAAIDKVSGVWIAERMAENYDTMGGIALKDAKGTGRNTVVELTPEDRARWEKALLPIVDKWKASHPNGEKLFAALQEELKKLRGGS
ncbi:MAG: TRAP transporter substrate-binding protein [Alphaproteobacteria bacterium]|nr:TRAP transporter substrate-binding protein [Alphaproteobacteria bacterium]